MSEVALTSLYVENFRNFTSRSWRFGERVNVLVGPNGTGKTNILEAISLLSHGRGVRRATYAEMITNGANRWVISGRIEDDLGETQIGTAFTRAAEAKTQKRELKINGEAQRSTTILSEYTSLLALTPDMDGLFRGSEGDKRRFLDTLVATLHPNHTSITHAYDTLVRQRNKVLEAPNYDEIWLSNIETQIAEKGVAITCARQETIAVLNQTKDDVLSNSFPKAHFALKGLWDEHTTQNGTANADEAEAALKTMLVSSRAKDALTGRTSVGPHRTDIAVTHAEAGLPARQCSTGEQKALLVSTILTHAKITATLRGQEPWLLLDEITSHFDESRRALMFDILASRSGQTFFTGTEAALFTPLKTAHTIDLTPQSIPQSTLGSSQRNV